MSRPEKNTVEFFPFFCKEGKGTYYLENKYGNDGFATWIKILRQLAVTNYHYLDLSDRVEMMFLASKCKVTEQVLENIINDLCDLKEFDKNLWVENKIIWSEKFIKHIQEAYKKRKNSCIDRNSLLLHLQGLGVRKLGKRRNKPLKSTLEGVINTQTRLDKTRLDKTRLDKIKEKSVLEILKNDNFKWEEFQMKYKNSISEFDQLLEKFPHVVEKEELKHSPGVLFGRLHMYASTWLANEQRELNKPEKSFSINR